MNIIITSFVGIFILTEIKGDFSCYNPPSLTILIPEIYGLPPKRYKLLKVLGFR
jgi:hypothetical protein